MIKLPEKLTGAARMFMDMADGGFEQHYRNEEFGINIIKTRENRKVPVRLIITHDQIPDKEFSHFDDLKAHVKILNEQIPQ